MAEKLAIHVSHYVKTVVLKIDGKCSYDIISFSNLCTNSECAYYQNKGTN